ncbi:hypothetical protein YH65_02590 [Sulfurovum lithotrophicum]|uniref:Tetratricopeptide repeat protein n=1 Tax=Sulfurovum lithotrophicum TaxID=206403 RepID=A0A7U4RQ27_9BACT|nr:tetratricopeptide repeat protein [Sulfurovum lithotrophicum]AKF24405.1 hypothetical protein YH65_02590 [Sulfurovum lithotrophicum]
MEKVLLLLLTSSLLFSSGTFEKIKNAYFKSYSYEQIAKYKEAVKTLAPLSKKYPNNYLLNLRLGWLFYLQKKYENATKYYKKAALLNTQALEPKLGLIRIYLATYSFEDAQNVATELLKKDYYNYYANLYMAKALNAQQKYTIASEVSKKMLQLYPTDILFLEQLLISYKAAHNKDYKKVYQNILLLDPNNIIARSTK